MIHILSTMTHPCLHYEINEAWLLAKDEDTAVSDEQAATHRQQPHTAAAADDATGATDADAADADADAVTRVSLASTSATGGRLEWDAIITEGDYKLDGSFLAYHADACLSII